MKSGLKRCIMAQNASPSLHEVVMLHTRTFLYPTVCRLVHSSKASLPLNVPDPELFRFESISVKLRANHEKISLFERFLDWSFSSQWFWRQVCLFQRQNWLSFLSRLIWRLQMKLSKWKSSINNFRNPRDHAMNYKHLCKPSADAMKSENRQKWKYCTEIKAIWPEIFRANFS